MRKFIVIFATILTACAAPSSMSISANERNQIFQEFASGDLELLRPTMVSGYGAAVRAGMTQFKLEEMFEQNRWSDLAIQTALVDFGSDLFYYYLGRSAEELGYFDAALVYYGKGIEESQRSLTGHCVDCAGFEFPAEFDKRIPIVSQKIIAAKSSPSRQKNLPDELGEATGFRGRAWGDSKSDVLSSVSLPQIDEKDGVVLFNSDLAGMAFSLGYIFEDDRLVSAGYVSVEKYVNDYNYVRDYNKLKELLSKKYGPPVSDRTVWYDDLYRDDVSDWGTAVVAGHLAFESEWFTPDTAIILRLTGEKFVANLVLRYDEKSTLERRREAARSSVLDDL